MAKRKNETAEFRIYVRTMRKSIPVSEEVYRDHTRYYGAFRRRMQDHGRCSCKWQKEFLCDGNCCGCEFQLSGDMSSLFEKLKTKNDTNYCLIDTTQAPEAAVEEVAISKVYLDGLWKRLCALLPEAKVLGYERFCGLTDAAIAKILGIPRTTWTSKKAAVRKQLRAEYPRFKF